MKPNPQSLVVTIHSTHVESPTLLNRPQDCQAPGSGLPQGGPVGYPVLDVAQPKLLLGSPWYGENGLLLPGFGQTRGGDGQ